MVLRSCFYCISAIPALHSCCFIKYLQLFLMDTQHFLISAKILLVNLVCYCLNFCVLSWCSSWGCDNINLIRVTWQCSDGSVTDFIQRIIIERKLLTNKFQNPIRWSKLLEISNTKYQSQFSLILYDIIIIYDAQQLKHG